MESFEMDAGTWTAVVGMISAVGAACGAAIKVVYARVTRQTDEHINRIEGKLDDCEKKHAECQQQHVEVVGRLAYLGGLMEGKGFDVDPSKITTGE